MLFFELVKNLEKNKKAQEQFENSAKSVGLSITFEEYLPLLKRYIDGNKINGKIDMMLNIVNGKIKKGEPIMDILGIDNISKKQFAEVFTPIWLVNDMLDKLPEEVWSNPDFTWIDNSCGSGTFLWGGVIKRLKIGLKDKFNTEKELNKHIATMIHGVDIQASNVAICRKYLVELLGEENKSIIKNNIVKANSLEFEYWGGKKFNVVVGNPPYGEMVEGNKTQKSLWDKFVKKSLDCLTYGGYLVYVHPPKWRKPESNIWDIMSNKNMIYLSMHDVNDGQKTFGAGTRYDWYVIKNEDYKGKTFTIDVNGEEEEVNLSEWDYLPNGMLDTIKKMFGEEVKVIYERSKYGSEKKWMSKNKTNFPTIDGITKKGLNIWYSSEDKGHFGVSKVFVNIGGIPYVYFDEKGEYGVGKNMFAFQVSNKQEGENIIKCFESDKMKKVVEMLKWGTHQLDFRAFNYFKKDFWKDFI